MNLRQKVLVLALAANSIACLRFGRTFYYDGILLPDIFTLCSLLVGLVLLDIYRLRPAASHTVHSLLVQYLAQKLFLTIGSLLHFRLKKACRDVETMQKDLLTSIIQQNRDTTCAKSFGLFDVHSVSDFISKVPLTKYDNYKVFAEVVKSDAGSADIFFPGSVDYIAMTSGTSTGESKKFPKSVKLMKRTMGKWICLAQKMFLNIPKNQYLRKWLAVRIKANITYSKSGIRCGPISAIASDMSINYYVTPKELMIYEREEIVLYINLIFGLLEEEICNLFFSTSQVALLFFKILERNWEQLCDDIDRGIVSQRVDLPGEIRATLEKHLRGGNSIRAKFLRQEFSKGFKNIVSRIWPSCPGLFCLATGTFVTQANILREMYLGAVPIFSTFHAGTETMYGMNIDLEDPEVTYLAMTTYNFFEFIPIADIESDSPRTVLAHEVEIGAMYELVVTTFEGLYRYRTEDVVQITGFYGTIPKYKFIHRVGDILSVCTERVPETFLAEAMRNTALLCNKTLMEFTTTESIHAEKVAGEVSGQQHYTIFAELNVTNEKLTEKEKLMVDEDLCCRHEVYRMFRSSGRIQPVHVVELLSGTFDEFRKFYLGLNPVTSYAQYKLPRILRREVYLRFLTERMMP